MHKSVTLARAMRLAESDMKRCENHGICTACGKKAEGVEPDAKKYKCESCGQLAVYGAEELCLML